MRWLKTASRWTRRFALVFWQRLTILRFRLHPTICLLKAITLMRMEDYSLPARVSHSGRGAHGHLRFRRERVQQKTSSLSPGLPQPRRVRTGCGEGRDTSRGNHQSSRPNHRDSAPSGSTIWRPTAAFTSYITHRSWVRLHDHLRSLTSVLVTKAQMCPPKLDQLQ